MLWELLQILDKAYFNLQLHTKACWSQMNIESIDMDFFPLLQVRNFYTHDRVKKINKSINKTTSNQFFGRCSA